MLTSACRRNKYPCRESCIQISTYCAFNPFKSNLFRIYTTIDYTNTASLFKITQKFKKEMLRKNQVQDSVRFFKTSLKTKKF